MSWIEIASVNYDTIHSVNETRRIHMPHKNVYNKIVQMRSQMSKAQVKIANYILDHRHSVPFLTGSKLAKQTDVSEATVVRFATFLGYKGYNQFQQALVESVEKQLNTAERLQMSREMYNETERTIYDIFNDDIANITSTMENLNIDDFQEAAKHILEAEKIYVVANRSAVSLGVFLHYYLDIIFGNTEIIHSTATGIDQMYNVTERDVVIGLSFARYTRNTIEIAAFAKERNATILAITDHDTSPITEYADIALFASSNMPSFLDSFTAPLSLINTLITYIGNHKHEEINDRLENLEKLWDRYQVFQEYEK